MELALPKMVWMEIDTKNKELPLKIADSPEELAMLCGTSANNIRSTASKRRRGVYNGRFVKVWIGDIL